MFSEIQWKCPFAPGETNAIEKRPEPNTTGRPFPIQPLSTTDKETKACRPSTGRGLKCLAPRYDLAEMCVATEHLSIQSYAGEGEFSFHERASRGTAQYSLLVQLVYQLMKVDSHLNPASSYVSLLHILSFKF